MKTRLYILAAAAAQSEARHLRHASEPLDRTRFPREQAMDRIRIGVLGASGYTGADLVRLAARHPNLEIAALTANTHAGKAMDEVFAHVFMLDLPRLVEWEKVDWNALDAVFCGLPHGTTQDIIAAVLSANPELKVFDMSADFRLRDMDTYAEWYGHPHRAAKLQGEAVYGLTEFYRDDIRSARLVACPGCYPTAALLALVPLAKAGLIDAGDVIIDAKSGVTGAGRGLKQNTLFSEAGEGLSPYSVAKHRHAPEIEQEIGVVAGRTVTVNFTPHLIPMSRGELCTSYVRLENATADDLRAHLAATYRDEPFVHVAAKGVLPQTQNVRGSNYVQMGVFADRIAGRAIVISVLDNLVKGSAGQALQNMNVAFGLDETTGLLQLPLFP
jgi:N-acetyl-gamma-glutamyl-phosphate reductase